MGAHERLRVETDGPVLSVVLARPDVHDAFDDVVVRELRDVFLGPVGDPSVRVVVLRSTGRHFSAGADLKWMKRMGAAGAEENMADAGRLADALEAVAHCPKPVVARVQGAALGGGLGLACAADVVVASEAARFGFTEVRLGLLPAVIAPHVLRAVPPGLARALFLTGERFDARRALSLGLVHRVVAPADLDEELDRVVADLLEGSPEAQAAVKRLLRDLEAAGPEETRRYTTAAIARARASRDGAEGLAAFLEKRRPDWSPGEGR